MADTMDNFQSGFGFGRGVVDDAYAAKRAQQVRGLAGQAYGAAPEQREALTAQMVAIDPDAGMAFGDQARKREADDASKLAGAARYVLSQYETGSLPAAEGAYQAVRPYLAKFGQAKGAAPPAPNFSEDMVPMLHQVIAAGGGGQGSNVQSKEILANGNIGIITRDGQVIDTGKRASPATQLINEPGQLPYLVTTGRGAVGQSTGIGPSGGRTAAPEVTSASMESDIALANDLTAAGIPAEQVDAFLRQRGQRSTAIAQPSTGGPVPQRNPTAAEVEAAKTSAREQVELANLPYRGSLEAQNAAAKTAAEERAKIGLLGQRNTLEAQGAGDAEAAKQRAQVRVELEQLLPKVRSESQRTVALIDKALNHPGREAATGASSKLDPRNFWPGSDATNFRVLLEQLKGGTFLQAFQSLKGGGAITQMEGSKAEQAIARLEQAQSDEEFIVALQELRDVAASLPSSIQQKLIAASGPDPSGGNVARPTTEADYNALQSGALFIDPDDGRTYRKP